jgi:hypothetical protein
VLVIARSDSDEAIHLFRAQLAARQPKLRASGLEGGASAQLKMDCFALLAMTIRLSFHQETTQ